MRIVTFIFTFIFIFLAACGSEEATSVDLSGNDKVNVEILEAELEELKARAEELERKLTTEWETHELSCDQQDMAALAWKAPEPPVGVQVWACDEMIGGGGSSSCAYLPHSVLWEQAKGRVVFDCDYHQYLVVRMEVAL